MDDVDYHKRPPREMSGLPSEKKRVLHKKMKCEYLVLVFLFRASCIIDPNASKKVFETISAESSKYASTKGSDNNNNVYRRD